MAFKTGYRVNGGNILTLRVAWRGEEEDRFPRRQVQAQVGINLAKVGDKLAFWRGDGARVRVTFADPVCAA